MQHRTFPSKLLLFGEYSLLKGSDALAIPFHGMSGRWQYFDMEPDERLMQWVIKMQMDGMDDFMDLNRMKSEVLDGLRFDSDIPPGFGLGSSGALCAAVYHRFHRNTEEIPLVALQSHLASLEGFFHQKSSGIDPLVSYLNVPVLLKDKKWQPIPDIAQGQMLSHFFLLNSGISRATAPLVTQFHQMMKNAVFNGSFNMKLIPYTNRAIACFINGEKQALFEELSRIQLWQMKYFAPMIPDRMMVLYEMAIREDFFKLKFCGAGGGGYFLGMSTDIEETKMALGNWDLVWL